MSNKPESRTYHRKYIGLITEFQGHTYFVPMSSPKDADYLANGEIKKDSLIKIYMRSDKVLYGTIRFNYMIPVPASELEKVTVNDEGDFKYRILMQSEYFFIKANRDRIEKTAVRLYKMRTTYNPKLRGNRLRCRKSRVAGSSAIRARRGRYPALASGSFISARSST